MLWALGSTELCRKYKQDPLGGGVDENVQIPRGEALATLQIAQDPSSSLNDGENELWQDRHITRSVCIARSTYISQSAIFEVQEKASGNYREVKSVCNVNAGNKPRLYKKYIVFASYGFSTICYFRMIAVFENSMRAMLTGCVGLRRS